MRRNVMKKLLPALILLTLAFPLAVAMQDTNSNSGSQGAPANSNAAPKPKRGPVFRASADQIKQAQAILKQRGFYNGEQTGKLDDDTRAGLQKYQQAEGLKVTGTLNKVTLEKMGIALTEKQKTV
jgi:peptidoglycan hydrolase-like protein with peptidoglycan-binding domain